LRTRESLSICNIGHRPGSSDPGRLLAKGGQLEWAESISRTDNPASDY